MDNREYYNSEKSNKSSRFYRTINEMLPELDASSIVLDYGTGTGLYAHEIALKNGCHVDAVDLDAESIEHDKKVWTDESDRNVSFMHTSEIFEPDGAVRGGYFSRYSLILSSQVMEHVHNVGNYVNRVSVMLKDNGYFVVSIPNTSTPRDFLSTLASNQSKIMKCNKAMLKGYVKAINHINSWDPYYFVTLMGSCGYELEKYIPMGGVPYPRRIYRDRNNKGLLKQCSYIMAFRFRKVKDIRWSNYD